MDENWAEALQDLKSVWQRVQGRETAALEAAAEESVKLEQLIESEAEGEYRYRMIARAAEGHCAAALREMSADCRQNLKRLQTEYFMETGDTFAVQPAPLEHDGLLGYLRREYLREGKASNNYLFASASAETEARRQLFGELSRRCTVRREKLYTLAGMMLG